MSDKKGLLQSYMYRKSKIVHRYNLRLFIYPIFNLIAFGFLHS